MLFSGVSKASAVSACADVSLVMANSSAGRVKLMAKKVDDDDKKMDVDDEDAAPRKASRRPNGMELSPGLSVVATSSGPEIASPLQVNSLCSSPSRCSLAFSATQCASLRHLHAQPSTLTSPSCSPSSRPP